MNALTRRDFTVCVHCCKHVVAIAVIYMAFLADVRIRALVESFEAGAHGALRAVESRVHTQSTMFSQRMTSSWTVMKTKLPSCTDDLMIRSGRIVIS